MAYKRTRWWAGNRIIVGRHFVTFFIIVLALFGPVEIGGTAEKESRPNEDSAFGINLGGVTYWSTEIVFVDLFKHSQLWKSQAPGRKYSQGGPLDLTEDGWVSSLADNGQFADSIILSSINGRYPGGVYTCIYDGRGQLKFAYGTTIVEEKTGCIKVQVKPEQNLLTLAITKTNTKDPVRNIRFILPGFEETYGTQPFHPDFLKRWENFKVIRFMDFQRTNNSRQADFSDRPTTAMQTQGGPGGVALDYMLQLANTLNADPWFCMPHLATDDYVHEFAQMVRRQLKPNLKVYIEYSNECWNSMFGQARYCKDKGKELRLSNNDYQAQLRFYSKRSVQIFKLWEEVFGGTKRLVRVLAAQSANPWTSVQVMDFEEAYKHADVLGIAPYFGHALGNPRTQDKTAKMSVDEVLEACEGYIEKNNKTIAEQAKQAKERGLRLIAYEGGQHLVGHGGAENNKTMEQLFHTANRHPRMKQLYLEYLAGWKQSGGTMMAIFSSTGRFSKWGSWGIMEYHGQPAGAAPKYQAVLEFLEKNPKWW
ncbi:MAG TPA: hypothetical protein HPP66_06190 [Planctomycetes bacterium]|nr:hypothetical protein [Planctomycetota bacterium]